MAGTTECGLVAVLFVPCVRAGLRERDDVGAAAVGIDEEQLKARGRIVIYIVGG